jgi:hypothetical protein
MDSLFELSLTTTWRTDLLPRSDRSTSPISCGELLYVTTEAVMRLNSDFACTSLLQIRADSGFTLYLLYDFLLPDGTQ